MSNEQFILELKRRKMWALLFLILCFLATLFIQIKYFNHYSGNVQFTITSGSIMDITVYEPVHPEKVYVEQKDAAKIFSIIYSNELLDSVIRKFNLYEHYHIDIQQPYHYEKIIQELVDNINIKIINENLMTLSFQNDDNVLAADIANEIINQVNFYFKRKYRNTLSNKIRLYETIMADVAEKDSSMRTDLYRILNNVKPFAVSMNEREDDPYSLRKKVDYLIDQLYFNKENFLGTYKLYRSALKASDELDIRIVTILRQALPESEKKLPKKLITSTAVSFFGLFVYIVLLYTYLINRNLIKLFFSK